MKTWLTSLKVLIFFTLLTGVIYPLVITGMAQILFPSGANGSLIIKNNQKTGSKFIGQQFDSAIYFMSRPSAVSYNPLPSGGSNYSPAGEKLKDLVVQRKRQFITFNQLDSLTAVPPDMLFASASGLDPHISPKVAMLQVNRIALARHFSADQKKQLVQNIQDCTEGPQFWVFGEERVNVLALNLQLDQLAVNIK